MTMPISVCKPNTIHLLIARNQRGFTLLEILLVVAIMAVAAVMVVPSVGSLDSRGFETQVREAHTLLNYARRTAVVTGQPASIAFLSDSEEGSEGEREEEHAPLLARDNVGRWQSRGIALDFLDSKGLETEIEQVLEVSFFPEGGSSGGTLQFELENQRTTIFIDPFTGRIERLNPEDEAGS